MVVLLECFLHGNARYIGIDEGLAPPHPTSPHQPYLVHRPSMHALLWQLGSSPLLSQMSTFCSTTPPGPL
jgi:hypothetical protein